jgi:hypothetical protein
LVETNHFKITTTLTPSPGQSGVENTSIPLQTLLLIGNTEQDNWIKAIWGSLKATRCFMYEEEAGTGGNSYRMIHRQLNWQNQ